MAAFLLAGNERAFRGIYNLFGSNASILNGF
jgi:hypothetical protein